MVRHNNQLPDNLPQLQNLLKRDPDSYKEEFLQQYQHFLSSLQVFQLTPSEENKSFEDVVMFVAQVAQCYPTECIEFPQLLVDLLKNHSTTLHPNMRNCFCKALILLRNKNLISALDLLELFFELLRCPDKNLRKFLQNHIVTDIKNMNAKHKDMKLNSTLQNFMFSMLKDSNPRAAKMSVDIMIELYNKNIWNDSKTVNVIANVGCFSKITKVLVASLKFFLGRDDDGKESGDSESDNEPDLKNAMLTNRVNKKTKKRKKQLEAIKRQVVKSTKKKTKAPSFNFSGVHLVNNPQGMAEALFKQLQSKNERFEVRVMHLDLISRLIGIHELFLFSFYPYITRFLQPHQRLVTKILQFAAQASHELVPGDIIEPILKTIANNFITERNTGDVMAIGLNAVREICTRCPLAMGEDLLRDLAMYKTYKERSVMMAARSLIMLYRDQLPNLLHKKDRGRPTEAQVEHKVKNYGEVIAYDTVPGAEALLKNAKTIDVEDANDHGSDSSDDDDSWVDVSQSEGEVASGSDGENDETDENEVSDDEEEEEVEDDNVDEKEEEEDMEKSVNEKDKTQNDKTDENGPVKVLDEKQAAQELVLTRIFTDEDFKRIDMANVQKSVTGARKRPLEAEKTEFVKLDNIEMIYKKRKHDKQTRLTSVQKGREDREKFGYKDGRKNENCSKTNREKRKRKNFVMMRHKARSKTKKSFKDKQRALRKHLLQQKKMK